MSGVNARLRDASRRRDVWNPHQIASHLVASVWTISMGVHACSPYLASGSIPATTGPSRAAMRIDRF